MDHNSYSDDYLRGILDTTATIAMVGASSKWNRPSYFVMKYLQKKGFRVIPIHPGQAGCEILGERAYASLSEVAVGFELVDVFRSPAAAAAVTDEAIAVATDKGIRSVWMQLGVRNDEAAARAEASGLRVVMNRCPKIEYARLHAELGWGGFNSRIISSRRRIIGGRPKP